MEFEDYEAKAIFILMLIIMGLFIIIISILYYLGIFNKDDLELLSIGFSSFMIIVIAVQSIYTKKSVMRSAKSQAWQIVGGPLYPHIAASLIALRLVAREVRRLDASNTDKEQVKQLFNNPFETQNEPDIIYPYIRPKPAIGPAQGGVIRIARIPSLREALDIIRDAVEILGEKDLLRELDHLGSIVEDIQQSLSKSGFEDSGIAKGNPLRKLQHVAERLEYFTEKAAMALHVPITGPLLEDFYLVREPRGQHY